MGEAFTRLTKRVWTTAQRELFAARWATYSATWPRSGMMRAGMCFRLPTSAGRISANASGLWPTPTVTSQDQGLESYADNPTHHAGITLKGAVDRWAKWPTPEAAASGPDYAREGRHGSGADWATPRANAVGSTRTPGGNPAKDGEILDQQAVQWATPRAEDGERGKGSKFDGLAENTRAWATPCADDAVGSTGGGQGKSLRTDIRAWATPAAHEGRLGFQDRERGKKGAQESATTDAMYFDGSRSRGPMPSPSPEATAADASSPPKPRGGGLNPRFGLWLMGFPVGWLDSAPSATRSVPRGSSAARSRKSNDSKRSDARET